MAEHNGKGIVIDIGDEVMRFANDQGHTKASKDTVCWDNLKTKSGVVSFTELSSDSQAKTYTLQDEAYKQMTEHLTVINLEPMQNEPIRAVAALERDKTATCEPGQPSTRTYFQENFLINTDVDKQLCRVTIRPSLPNIAEAHVKFTRTLLCSKEDTATATDARVERRSQSSTSTPRASQKGEKYPLSRVSLSPKFSASLGLKTVKPRRLPLAKRQRHEVIVKIPPGIKVPVEIIRYEEEQSGIFEVDYYLWGSVQVTVWGKPYNLIITDILDPKNNPIFTRESLAHNGVVSDIQAVKVTLHGSYQVRKAWNEIKLRIPKCILRRPSYSLESLKCTCDVTELPVELDASKVLPLTDSNVARIIFRWKQILYSFRSSSENNDNQWLWKSVLKNNTALATLAKKANIEKHCKISTAIDKFVLAIILWRENCSNLATFGQSMQHQRNGKALTVGLTKELYELGIPVPVFNFLWQDDKHEDEPLTAYECPSHRFSSDEPVDVSTFSEGIASKVLAPLPDRVLLRLLQRWPEQDGWLAIALHLGIDHSNIASLATKDSTFTTLQEKRLTVFKLWRMKQRRSSISIRKEPTSNGQINCTTLDLCTRLHEMRVPKTTYNFIWLDSETTP